MSFSKYPAYKDSGVEWLGEVPAHWAVVPFKRCATIFNGKDHKNVETEDGDIPVIGSGGEFSRASNYLYDGESILLGRKGTIDKPLYVEGKFWTVDTMFYSVVSPPSNGRFLYYSALKIPFSMYSTNTALPSMTQESLSGHLMAIPPPDEQATVAAFLDHETGKIDALIEEQRRLIELLKEKRQAVISHAVTKGLDPNVPMKDSGVEWLGEVPAHWGVVSLSRVLSGIDQGWSPTAEAFPASAGDWGVLKLSAIRTGQFVEKNNKKLPDDVIPDSDIEIHAGDLLVTRANTPELVGDACVVRDEPEARLIFSDLVYRLRVSGAMSSRFLCYVLLSDVGRAQLQADARGSSMSMAKISHGHIKSCLIPLPPVEEQNRISSRIDQELAAISTLTSAGEQSIGLLTERRSALISAAVTGKIDVRGWSAGVEVGEPELAMVAEESAGYSAQGGGQ
ncbi:restriction endonuclease subunit S [Thioalkalivibrio sp. ALE11]|uniref:restriction endonuclease subunit S n=1 Tax=Thioalkalivibrio sp. ALE11 TaxID=1265494 RepID=UPI0004772CB9|nr:restriction endonuclease subunit S [Thioalkalivibrio sp. ALE11]